MRFRRGIPIPFILGGIILGSILLFILFHESPTDQVEEVVRDFYKYEQKADFSSSWNLFHPLMENKFSKSDYIQQRNHVFVGHFGVETFSYKLGEIEEISKWRMAKDFPTLENVYSVPVSQTFKSSFGTFTLKQEVVVAKVDGDWKILWSYQ